MYKAFISYSHAGDGRLAPALQSALERFAKPWYKVRYFNVFRDEASLYGPATQLGNFFIRRKDNSYR